MKTITHPAAIAAAALVSIATAALPMESKVQAQSGEPVRARDLEMAKGWPYFDTSWDLRGKARAHAVRVVVPSGLTNEHRNEALRALAAGRES